MNPFTSLAPDYARRAVVQRSASGPLFELLAIGPLEDVLDLGCGPGHLTRRIRELTAGAVWGVDPSPGMIAEALRQPDAAGMTFHLGAAEEFDRPAAFDVVFCNSAFQWFRDPAQALARCFRNLRPGGRLGIQAPARSDYCPNFRRATDALRADARTQATFAAFRPPWFLRETAGSYAALAVDAGLEVEVCRIDTVSHACSPEAAFAQFSSGAAAGYLNPDCYDQAWAPGYAGAAGEVLAAAFREQAGPAGVVGMAFHRLYLLARRPPATPAAESR
jgi:trans-aconitate methyltransferase